MKKNEVTTLGALQIGDIFTIVKNGIHFKRPAPNHDKTFTCDTTNKRDVVHLSANFLVYFISTPVKNKAKKPRYIQGTLF